MFHLKRIDEIADILIAPNESIHTLQIGPIIGVGPYAADTPFLFSRAFDFPLLPARFERTLAHQSDNAVRAPDTRTHTVFPILVVWLLYGHIDEFVRRTGMKRLSFQKIPLSFIFDGKGNEHYFFISHRNSVNNLQF